MKCIAAWGVLGCLLFFQPLFAQAPTWSADVAPIFYKKCVQCHSTGGLAPFSLENPQEATLMRYFIKDKVSQRLMPPWPPVAPYRHFVNERVLSQGEIDTIVAWVDAGAPAGNLDDTPPLPKYNNGPVLGKPDMKLTIPTHTTTAYTQDEYACFVMPTNLTRDKYVKGIHIIPGNRSIVHHVIVSLDTTGQLTDCMSALIGAQTMYSWAAGMSPAVFPDGADLRMGMRIKAGSNIMVQIHYPTGSGGKMDSTSVLFYFYDDAEVESVNPPLREVKEDLYVMNWLLYLPPNTEKHYTAQWPYVGPTTEDISLISVDPHMHLLGRKIISYAVTPANDTIQLVKVDNWDYHWQSYYFYPHLIKIPKGSIIYGEADYDNTTNNVHNPFHPPQAISAGEQTNNEMFLIAYQYTTYKEDDENFDIEQLINNTINEATAVPEVNARRNPESFSVYPNPSDGQVNIYAQTTDMDNAEITISDVLGRVVFEKTVNGKANDPLTFDIGSNPDGVYLVQVRKDNLYSAQRMVLGR